MATKRTKKAPASKSYTATLKVLGRNYESTGKDIAEAISNLKPELAKGIAVLTLIGEKKSQERLLYRTQTSRLFSPSALVREIMLKQIAARFEV